MARGPWHKTLIGILTLALIVEIAWPVAGFLVPETMLKTFMVEVTPGTLFLVHVLAWCLLFVAMVCALNLFLVRRNDPAGWLLSYVMGWWWVGIGISLFVFYGRIENLILDGLKGLIILVAAWRSKPQKSL